MPARRTPRSFTASSTPFCASVSPPKPPSSRTPPSVRDWRDFHEGTDIAPPSACFWDSGPGPSVLCLTPAISSDDADDHSDQKGDAFDERHGRCQIEGRSRQENQGPVLKCGRDLPEDLCSRGQLPNAE